ncbi:MAG: XdhC family protein [Clostridium argentinense]|uniref:XdhC family protein n=1 Tax=Clostridium faecium TaxID=2762223 RepID=A0ABR8YQW5_9CLOT|nr:XdhC/CoxI family protein [Clostridium faecium]MBD8046284.1 XdhC family protein [Clostridium faecium]MBS5824237.1 XdhC family protein [Clostridium argentinense]MDU1349488.1 XdhC/CoxI family protein [Clostridium argentinense]
MNKNIYGQVQQALENGQRVNIMTTFSGEEGIIGEGLTKKLILDDQREQSITEPVAVKEGETISFYEPIALKDRLVILGGGHVALPLCEFASKTGFHVTVVDDRPEFANHLRFPWASKVICEGFEPALKKLSITDADYITIVTRGHRYDADCLRYILKYTQPFYLGMIGSKRRVKGLFQILEEEGYDREKISRICSPIGLDIGAVLPEEIAISILAELILYKRGSNIKRSNKIIKKNIVTSDLDSDVITYLASLKESAAVVTVMNTKGSTPRSTGAKMVVNSYGKVYGSIGGGCAEKDIINIAIQIIGTGKYQVVKQDLTGDVAESEGMVCGGIMDILIEDFNIN